jgi:hypothetical protein
MGAPDGGANVEVRIGLSNTVREVELELADDVDGDAVKASIDAAVASGSGLVWLEDRKGRRVGLVAEKIAYVDLGPASDKGRIGFG